MGDISNQNGAHEDSTACSPWTSTKLFVSLKQLLMFKASLDRGQAPDFEIKLSVVSSKFIRDEPEIRLAQLASSARASCYAWTEAFISLCPEKWMTWWRACCLASVVPQFGSTGMGFTGFATWWGTESQAAELSKTLRPQSISKCPHHPHPFCGTELQTTRNPKQVRQKALKRSV